MAGIRDVLRHRAIEQQGVLRNQPHLAAQAGQVNFADVTAIDADYAIVGVDKATDRGPAEEHEVLCLALEGHRVDRQWFTVDVERLPRVSGEFERNGNGSFEIGRENEESGFHA